MSNTDPNCGVELRDAFTAYLDELTVQMKMAELPPDLYKDWLRYRLDRLGKAKVSDLSPRHASQLYADMQAAFPLVTVPLDDPRLPVAPVPFQEPMPPFTGEMASIVQNRLYEILGPNAMTEQQIMEVVNAAVRSVQPSVEQERFWTVIGQDGTIHPEYMAAYKKDVKKPAEELEREGSRIGLVEFREVPHGH